MTLKEALETIAEYCRRHDCGDCPFARFRKPSFDLRPCKLQVYIPENWKEIEVEE